MDLATIIATLILSLAALLSFRLGWTAGARKAHRSTVARCSCGHARGFHMGGKGACKADRFARSYKDGCQVYDGPEPLPSLGDVLRDGPS